MRELLRVEVRHRCGHRVVYAHDLGPFILARWHERAESEPCRRCLARANLDTLMGRRRDAAVQLTLF